MFSIIKRIWNYDFAHSKARTLRWWFVPVAIFLVVFGVYDLLNDTGAGFYNYILGLLSESKNPLSQYIADNQFQLLAYVSFGFLVVYISGFAIISFRASVKEYGFQKFFPIFLSHLLANAVAMVFSFLFFASLGVIAWALGFTYHDGVEAISQAYAAVRTFMTDRVPTITVLPYPIALGLGVVMGALPGYFSHWLGHRSRLVWYATHRCHHTAEIMHSAGVGPFFFLSELTTNIPTVFISAICTKLFYYEPLLFETIFLAYIGILTEKFNHTTVFYDFAYQNPLVRWVSAYFGNGVYHYMHHTSKQGDEIVNIGGTPFLIWDRIFGTYRKPTEEKPNIGLTNNPKIKLSPFAIVLSGWQQLAYELKMNKSLKERFLIIFGDIYYKPPITKDFLILGYPEQGEMTEEVTPVNTELLTA